MSRPRTGARLTAAMAAAVAALGIGAADASATTLCVPTFSAACTDSGGNVATADPEEAMSLFGKDGVADRVVIAAGTFTETGTFEPPGGSPATIEPYGSDPLVVEGAGPDATILTTAGSGNIFVFNSISASARPATLRNLSVRIPAGFPNNQGAGLQIKDSVLENVDIVSLNEYSDGIASAIGSGNVFRGGEIRGEGGGSIKIALTPGSPAGGSLLVEDSAIISPSIALETTGEGNDLTARRVRILDAGTGADATAGSVAIENSLMTIGTPGGRGLNAHGFPKDASISADHLTLVTDEANLAINITKTSEEGDNTVTMSNSIVRGFPSSYNLLKAIGPGIGAASLAIRYSNLPLTGDNTNGTLDVATGNIDADPLFAPDYSLPPSSPSVDAGDPAGGGPATDILGAPRPTDGDGDGVARQDQGAFEYQPPAPPPQPHPLGPASDTRPPNAKITKGPGKKLAEGVAKFSFSADEARSTFRCKLDRKKPAKCKSPKAYKHLKPGRHTFKVRAIDPAGNESKAAKRSFTVPE